MNGGHCIEPVSRKDVLSGCSFYCRICVLWPVTKGVLRECDNSTPLLSLLFFNLFGLNSIKSCAIATHILLIEMLKQFMRLRVSILVLCYMLFYTGGWLDNYNSQSNSKEFVTRTFSNSCFLSSNIQPFDNYFWSESPLVSIAGVQMQTTLKYEWYL